MTKANKLTIIKIVTGIVLLSMIGYFIKHTRAHPPDKSRPLPIVMVMKPQQKSLPDYVVQTGNTVAFNAVNLVARVEGYLDAIEFVDGTFIKKGTELFVIEPEPYMQKLLAARATVAAQKASYRFAKAEYERQQQMYKEHATSLKSVEKWEAQADIAKAEIAKAEADEAIAAINYSYTHIHAPFDGRIGRHLVDQFNLVGNGKATNLATLEQIAPLYVYFNLNEIDLLKLRDAMKAQSFKTADRSQIPVYVGLQNDSGYAYQGQLDFVNTGLNSSTGTMQFRALLPNKDYQLVPGLFVNVRIPISKPSSQLLIPATALQYDQIGAYLFVVDKDNRVLIKRVTLGAQEQQMQQVVQGIEPQDRVIVSGLQNAIPGNQVNPKMQTEGR